MRKKSFFTAFTLAEVLITLGIIGVVAAMTIPTLVNNSNDVALKTGWKKAFTVISQAHSSLISENLLPFENTAYAYPDALAAKLKVSERCTVPAAGCWHAANQIYTVANTPVSFTGNSGDVVYHLADGMMIYFYNGGFNPVAPLTPAIEPNIAGFMLVDVNGFRKPNRMGYDIYGIEYYGNALVAGGASNSYYEAFLGIDGCNRAKPALTSFNNGITCGAKVLQNISY